MNRIAPGKKKHKERKEGWGEEQREEEAVAKEQGIQEGKLGALMTNLSVPQFR